MTDRKIKNLVLLSLLVALVAMAGCSCKEYEEQIMQLDAQVAELQQDLSDREGVIAEREQVAEDLRRNLEDCKGENLVLVEESEEVIMITVPDQLVYSSSQVIVLDTMVPALEAIGATIKQHGSWDVFVEGYTDDRRISEEFQEQYPSNWELSTARAAAVVRYLILHAEELLSRPMVWTALKRTLRTRELRPADPSGDMGLMVTETLEPEPIPLNVKVILIGEPQTYYMLQQADQEFDELFKVKVDFTPHMDRTPEAELGYASFVAARCEREDLPQFENTAVAAVVEEGSRLASNQLKLSTRFRAIRDLVREAAHVASEEDVAVV